MKPSVNVIRLLFKTAVLFVVFNVIYGLIDPPIGKLTAYNVLWPGRVRFPYAESPAYYQASYNAPVIEDFDAMFGSHVISQGPKPADEYRVFLLGDSSTWGGHVGPSEMLAGQLNRLALTKCGGKTVKVYDLGYPWPSLTRDILVLDRAMQYQPDLILWMVTLHSFEKKPQDRDFLAPHTEQMERLVKKYDIKLPKTYLALKPPTFWERTIIGQRKHIKDVLLGQVFGPLWAATGVDNYPVVEAGHPPISQDMLNDPSYLEYKNDTEVNVLIPSLMFDIIRAGHEMAGDVPMIVINEPIFVAHGANSDLRYNEIYPHWAYDAYRSALTNWITPTGYEYYDYWNAIPPEEFANAVFHRDPIGEAHFAQLVAPRIQDTSCR
jgi:hypothetical protein